MTEQIKINWYRCKVDKAVMSELMKKSDARGFLQAVPPLLIFAATGTLSWFAYRNVHADNWPWALPLLLLPGRSSPRLAKAYLSSLAAINQWQWSSTNFQW